MRDLLFPAVAFGFIVVGAWLLLTPNYELLPTGDGVWKINTRTGDTFLCKIDRATSKPYCLPAGNEKPEPVDPFKDLPDKE